MGLSAATSSTSSPLLLLLLCSAATPLFLPSSMDATTATGGGGGGSEEEDQARMDAISEKLQTRDAMRLYGWLSQRCFSDCVSTFYRKALGKREGDCVRACVHKYLLFTTASSARFAELADPSASDDD